jgi:hypothetical protein
MSLQQTFPQNFEFKRLIPFKKIKIAGALKMCYADKIEVKMFGKNQNGTT